MSLLQETVDTCVSNNFAEGMELKPQMYCKKSHTILYNLSGGTSSCTTVAVNIVCEHWEMLSTGKKQRCQVLEHISLFSIKVVCSCILVFPTSNSVCTY